MFGRTIHHETTYHDEMAHPWFLLPKNNPAISPPKETFKLRDLYAGEFSSGFTSSGFCEDDKGEGEPPSTPISALRSLMLFSSSFIRPPISSSILRKRNIVSSSTPHEGGKRIGNPQNQTYQQYFALDLQNLVFPATITQRNPFRYNFRVSQQSTIQAHIKIDAGDEML
ncbi:hypothetical protein M9H77_01652 [Catharanthus roseus]|uniref:Uncharacterized protein n=1 Tax=Catharanthus roseus TaxID=4058 RepID=A0ACC0C6A9_CATRO|nr:hypothetical protein M9H77_01652 [Catharanthus roseus]